MSETVAEEVQSLMTQCITSKIGHDVLTIQWSRKVSRHHITDACRRGIGHHHQTICKEHGLVDVMGDQQRSALLCVSDLRRILLQVLRGDRVKNPKGFIQDEHLRPDRQGTGDGYALLHAAGNLCDQLVSRLHQTRQQRLPGTGCGEAGDHAHQS
jgi:hypothetical protein